MRVIRQSGVFYLCSAPLYPSRAESFRINLVCVFVGGGEVGELVFLRNKREIDHKFDPPASNPELSEPKDPLCCNELFLRFATRS